MHNAVIAMILSRSAVRYYDHSGGTRFCITIRQINKLSKLLCQEQML